MNRIEQISTKQYPVLTFEVKAKSVLEDFQNKEKELREDYENNRRDSGKFEKVVKFYYFFHEDKLREWIKLYGKDSRIIAKYCHYYTYLDSQITHDTMKRRSIKEFIKESPNHLYAWNIYLFCRWSVPFPSRDENDQLFTKLEKISLGLLLKNPVFLEEAEMLPDNDPLSPLYAWIKSVYYFQIHGSLPEKYRLLISEAAEDYISDPLLVMLTPLEGEWIHEFLRNLVNKNPSEFVLFENFCNYLFLHNKYDELSSFIEGRLAIVNAYKVDNLIEQLNCFKIRLLKKQNRNKEALELCLKENIINSTDSKYQLVFLELILDSPHKQRYESQIKLFIDSLFKKIKTDNSLILDLFNVLNDNNRNRDVVELFKIALVEDVIPDDIIGNLIKNKLTCKDLFSIRNYVLSQKFRIQTALLCICVHGFISNFQHSALILWDLVNLNINSETHNYMLIAAYMIQGNYAKVETILKECNNPGRIAVYKCYLAIKRNDWNEFNIYFDDIEWEEIRNQINGLEAFEKGDYLRAKKQFEFLPFKNSEIAFCYWNSLKKLNLTREADNYLKSLTCDQKFSFIDNQTLKYRPTLFENYMTYELDLISNSNLSEENFFKLVWFFVDSRQSNKIIQYRLLSESKYKSFLDFVNSLLVCDFERAYIALQDHIRAFPNDLNACRVTVKESASIVNQIFMFTELRSQKALALLNNLENDDLSILITYYVKAAFSIKSILPDLTKIRIIPYLPILLKFKKPTFEQKTFLFHLSDYIENLIKNDPYNLATQELWLTLLVEKGNLEEALVYCDRYLAVWDSLEIPPNSHTILIIKIKIFFLQDKNKEALELCYKLWEKKYIDYEFYLIFIELLYLEPKDNSQVSGSIIESFLANVKNLAAFYELYFLLKKIKHSTLGLVYQKILSSSDFIYSEIFYNNNFEVQQVLIYHENALKNGGNEASIKISRIFNLIRCFSNPKTIRDDILYLLTNDKENYKIFNICLAFACLIEGDYAAAEKILEDLDDSPILRFYIKIYLLIKSKNWDFAEKVLNISDIPHLRGLLAFEKGDYPQAKQCFEQESFKNKEIKLVYFKTLVLLNEQELAKDFYDSLPADVKLTHPLLKQEYDELIKKTAKPLVGKVKSTAKPPHKEILGFIEKKEKREKVKEFDPSKLIGPLAYPYDPRFQNEGGPDPIAELTFQMRKAKLEALELIGKDNQEVVAELIKPTVKFRPVLSHKIELLPAKETGSQVTLSLELPEGIEIITPPAKVSTDIFLFSGPYALRISHAVQCLEELFSLETAPMNLRVYLCIKAFELIHPARAITIEEETGIALLNQYGIKTDFLKSFRNNIVHYSYLLDGFVVLQFCRKLKETNLLTCLQEALMLKRVPKKLFDCNLSELKVIDPKWIKRSDDWAIEVKLSTWHAELERNLKLIRVHFQKGFENVKREHQLSKEDLNHLKIIKIAIVNVRTLITHIKEVDRDSGLKLEATYLEFMKFGNKFAHVQFSLEDITLELCLSFAQLASKQE